MALVATTVEPLRNKPIPHGQVLRRIVQVQFPATYVQGEPFGGAPPAINAGPGTQLNAQQLGFRKILGVVVLGCSSHLFEATWNTTDSTLRILAAGAAAELAGASAAFANGTVVLEVTGL